MIKKQIPIQELQKLVIKFRDKRDWKQFHNPKDSAISLSLEAAELLEHFQWKNEKEVDKYLKIRKNEVGDELSDVLFWVLLISHDLELDIVNSFIKKLEKNKLKYPIGKSKGKHTKYNKL